jgi:hypothetical protein
MTRPSVSAAIAKARREVQLVQWGRQWQCNTWSQVHRAWWSGNLESYALARARASRHVVAYALRLLGVDPHHADGLSVRYDSGSVRDRVKSALAEVTP